MTDLKFLILGDDFTPAALFEDAIRTALDEADAATFHCVDAEPDGLIECPSDEVREAFGDEREVAGLAQGSHVIVTTFAPVTVRVFDAAPELLAVACGRGGPINVNVAEASRRGVPVLFAPGRNARAVAEYTVAAMINLMRQVPEALDYVRGGRWQTAREDTFEKPSGPELGSRTIGLVGCGLVGALVGRLTRAFGARVLGCDPHADGPRLADAGIEPVSLDRLLAEADVISIHARLPAGAPPLLGPSHFAAMARRPYVLNTARAAALDYEALAQALRDDRIAGAYLDVYPAEPIPADSPLLAIDRTRLHLTPHAAGVSRDIPLVTARLLADGLAALFDGRRLDHVVNPETVGQGLHRMRALFGR